MKINKLFLGCLAMFWLTACGTHEHEEHAHEGHDHAEEVKETKDEHAHEDGDGVVVMHDERAKKLGIKVETIQAAPFSEVFKVGGEIAPAPTVQSVVVAKSSGVISFRKGMVAGVKVGKGAALGSISSAGVLGGDPKEQAVIEYNRAKKEYERVKALYDAELATAQELNNAKSTMDMAKNAIDSNQSSTEVRSDISGVISQMLVQNGAYVSVGTPVAVVNSGTELVLTATVPQQYYSSYSLINSANFKMPGSEKVYSLAGMSGRRLSSGELSQVSNGYFTVSFSFNNDGTVVPGSYVEVYLLGVERPDVISVPEKAVIEEQGTYSVFVSTMPEHYEKRQVVLGNGNGERVEVKSGLKPGDKVVSEGAVYVKLAANTGAIPEGHHHH